jgi:HupE / UreJ protein
MAMRSAGRVMRAPLLLLVLVAGEAHAHGRSTSTSSWQLDTDGASVLVRVQLADLSHVLPETDDATPEMLATIPALQRAVGDYLLEHVALRAGDGACSPAGPPHPVPSQDPTRAAYRWRLDCAGTGARQARVDLFLEAVPNHLHLARFTTPEGDTLERIFVLDSQSQALGGETAAAPAATRFLDYLALGVEHIATGFDHLLFLLALLLVGASALEVATIVTGFTLAHSVSLALGVLGVVTPRPVAIEALIGLSIAVVALENFALTGGPAVRRRVLALLVVGIGLAALGAWAGRVAVPVVALVGIGLFACCYLGLLERAERPARMRWFVAFVFGLIHGFGFAGLLTEIGLPPGRLAAALLGFNLGVEAGQLVLVALAWPLLYLALRGGPERRALVAQLGSTPVLIAGLYWFLTRSLG